MLRFAFYWYVIKSASKSQMRYFFFLNNISMFVP